MYVRACVRLCTYMRSCIVYLCVRANVCVREYVRIRVYVSVCVYICIHVPYMCVCMRVRVCMHVGVCMCVCMQVHVRACTCEGNEGALPLGPSSPIEGQPPKLFVHLRGGFPGLSPFTLKIYYLITMQASRGPCNLDNKLPTHRKGVKKRSRSAVI